MSLAQRNLIRRVELENVMAQFNDISDYISFSRVFIPLMVKGMDLGDGPMTVRGKEYPDYVPDLPDSFLLDVVNSSDEVRTNTIKGEESPTGGPLEEKQDVSPIETSTP